MTRVAAPIEIDSVALRVRDLDRVARFYVDVLGLVAMEQEGATLRLSAGGDALLCLREDASLRPRDPGAAGLFHVAYLLPSREDLGRWLNHAARIGVALDGAADHLVSEAVYLHDPEGNGIEIYRDRDPRQWRWDQGQVVMANDRLDLDALRRAPGEWTDAPAGTRVGHVHLQVGATDAAARFYTETFGFAVTRRWPQAVFMATGGYHHQVAANTWHSAGAGRRDDGMAGLDSVTLRVQTVPPTLNGGVADPWGTQFRVRHSVGAT